MRKKLTASNLSECQSRFHLSYHVNYAHVCEQLIGFTNKDVLEVGGSLPPDFVFEYLNVNSWSAIETPDYAEALQNSGGITHTGTIINKIEDFTKLNFTNRQLERYNLFLDNIENLPSEYYGKYDLIFSIAAFEHIHKFPTALEKMFLSLKPGGKVFSMFSPIWSSFNGHHLPEINDEQGNHFNFSNSPIPPWGHLLMTPPEMCLYLYQFTDKNTAELMTYYIYNSPHINRFFSEDYIKFFTQSNFTVSKLELTTLSEIDKDTQLVLEQCYPGRKFFTNNGILVILEKSSQSLEFNQNQFFWGTQGNYEYPNKPLSNNFELRNINLIFSPNWKKKEAEIVSELLNIISIVLTHPDKDMISLLIKYNNNISIDDANILLSSTLVDFFMLNDLSAESGPKISLVENLENFCESELPHQINYQIILNDNCEDSLNLRKKIPKLRLEQIKNFRFSQTNNSRNHKIK